MSVLADKCLWRARNSGWSTVVIRSNELRSPNATGLQCGPGSFCWAASASIHGLNHHWRGERTAAAQGAQRVV